jgi:membrane-associated protein
MPGIDLTELVRAFGYIGIAVTIVAESALLLGIHLPGNTLLFMAGLPASQDLLDIRILVLLGLFISREIAQRQDMVHQ